MRLLDLIRYGAMGGLEQEYPPDLVKCPDLLACPSITIKQILQCQVKFEMSDVDRSLRELPVGM